MKTKTFLLVCLIMGIGLTKLSAQGKSDRDNHAITDWFITSDGYFPLVCSDVAPTDFLDPTFEWLHATVTVHVVEKLRDSLPYLTIWKVKWEDATSNSGEVFKVNEKDIIAEGYNQDGVNVTETWMWYANIIGNRGSKYHLAIKIVYTYTGIDDNWDQTWTVIKADCR
jgi:hypothetical protein